MAANILGDLTPRPHLITEQHNTVATFVIMLSGWADYSREENLACVCVCVYACILWNQITAFLFNLVSGANIIVGGHC